MALTLCAPTASSDPSRGGAMRLVDAIGRVEPSWVEAVAVVQAICARLEPGQAPPALHDIMLSREGHVSFPPSGRAGTASAIDAAGQLLTALLGQGVCPMPVWDATELARRSPKTFGSPKAFGASLSCVAAHDGPQELAAYFQSSLTANTPTLPVPSSFAVRGLTIRAVVVLLAVTLCGIGAGVSVGALLAVRTAPGVAAVTGPRGETAMLGAAAVLGDLK